MLKAHIIVTQDIDVTGALESLRQLAQKHRLDATKSDVMLEHVGTVIANIKDSLSELTNLGISTDIKRTASSEEYQVTLEARQGRAGKVTKGNSFLSFLRL